MKYLLVICDGMADIPDENGLTPLMQSHHPNMDFLAQNGKCGLIDFNFKDKVDSDIGYLKLLSSFEGYPGRGYIEALGANVKDGDVFIRANFATLDGNNILIDRRAGRDETGLEELSKEIDGIEIEDVKFTVKKITGHRLIISMKGEGLSDLITPNDRKKVNIPLPEIKPKKLVAKKTTRTLNQYLREVSKILRDHPINKKRNFPANCILIRNAGHKHDIKSFEERFNLKGCCIAGINLVKGVANYLNMDFIKPEGATGDPNTNLDAKANETIKALRKYDFVFLHINGTDILSHDHKKQEKIRFIEKIDQKVIKKILDAFDLNELMIIITSDHRTVSHRIEGYEHRPDPVPICVCGNKIKEDEVKRFDEMSVIEGSLKLKNEELLPLIFSYTQ